MMHPTSLDRSTTYALSVANRPARRRRRRWPAWLLGIVIVLTAATLYLTRDPMPHFEARRSSLADVETQPVIVDGDFLLQPLRITGASGLSVNVMLKRAIADSGRQLPLVVILGGHRTGQDAARLLGPTEGAIVAAMSYPYEGEPRPDALTFLRDIPRIRQAFLDTPPAIMLALDHLLTLPDVDPHRVEVVGVSLGTPFAAIAGALDPRFTRVWVVHGSGGSYAPLEMNLRRTIGFAPLRWLAAGTANVIIAGPRIAAEQWVPQIAPRPFVMVNARDEERLPREHIERLYDAARQPKELIWTDGSHVRSDSAVIRPLVEIVLSRVTAP